MPSKPVSVMLKVLLMMPTSRVLPKKKLPLNSWKLSILTTMIPSDTANITSPINSSRKLQRTSDKSSNISTRTTIGSFLRKNSKNPNQRISIFSWSVEKENDHLYHPLSSSPLKIFFIYLILLFLCIMLAIFCTCPIS